MRSVEIRGDDVTTTGGRVRGVSIEGGGAYIKPRSLHCEPQRAGSPPGCGRQGRDDRKSTPRVWLTLYDAKKLIKNPTLAKIARMGRPQKEKTERCG
jgi:hypothetical protein